MINFNSNTGHENKILVFGISPVRRYRYSACAAKHIPGKVTDKEGHVLPGARIKISVGFTFVAEVQADDKGLYYTQLLPAGGYNIAVAADGKHEHTKRRVLLERTGSYDRRFYNLALTGKKLHVQVTDADPFMAAKLDAPDPAKRDVYMGEVHAIMKIDKDGKMIGETGVPRSPEAVPSVKRSTIR